MSTVIWQDLSGRMWPLLSAAACASQRCLVQVAFVGFAVQALASRTAPIEGLLKHLGNPGYNITYTLTHLNEVNTY